MRVLKFCGLSVSLLVGLGWAVVGGAADTSKEFRAAKSAFQHQIKKKAAADRVKAFQELASYPTPEAAGLIVKLGLTDPEPEVCRAGSDALIAHHEHLELGKHLLQQVTLTTRRGKLDLAGCYVLRALAAYDFPEIQEGIVKFLDQFVPTHNANLLPLTALIDDLGLQGDAPAMQTIALLSKAKLFARHFGYRRCIVQAVNKVRVPEGITFLIDLLPDTEGLVQFDIVQHLRDISHEDFKDDQQAWKIWWEKNRGMFKFSPGIVTRRPDGKVIDGPTYYGVPICAKRVVFVLDISRSMEGRKLEAAKYELIKTLKQLPEPVNFSMVFFAGTVQVWRPSMVPATEEYKTQAMQAVEAQITRVHTASYDAIEAAFALDPEQIFFLSDGAPTIGKVSRPAEILSAITQGNRTRRVSIESIGVGTNEPGGQQFSEFMSILAGSNYGNYVIVNQ